MANHTRDSRDDIGELIRRIKDLEASRSLGAQAAPVTSTTHPANPAPGRRIFETDTGLEAWWNGTLWVYPPQRIKQQVFSGSAASITFTGIPQVFTNLELILTAHSDGTGSSGYDTAAVQFNGVTSGYNGNSILSVQSSGTVSASGGTAQASITCAHVWNAHFGTDGRGIARVSIPNYSSASGMKGLTSLTAASDGGAAGVERFYTGFSGANAAITSLTVLMNTGNFTGAVLTLNGS
jgi:hypothetical protein